MPVLQKANPRPGPGAPDNPHDMVICHVGPRPSRVLQEMSGGLTHLLVAVDKLTKWIEVRPLAKISSKKAIAFVMDIIFRFGVPNSIIIDNDTHFIRERFLNFCDNNNIRVDWAMVVHPRMNG
jgi:hypothetical protein